MLRPWEERWGFSYPLPFLSKLPCVWCGEGLAMFSLTLLLVLKICAVLFISDVAFMIPDFSRDCQILTPFLYFKKHSWTIPSLTPHLQGLKNLVMSRIDCNSVHDTRLEGWWHFLHFDGSPTFEINHACLEICHHQQMQHWRSQSVFGVAGYCPIWRAEIIH